MEDQDNPNGLEVDASMLELERVQAPSQQGRVQASRQQLVPQDAGKHEHQQLDSLFHRQVIHTMHQQIAQQQLLQQQREQQRQEMSLSDYLEYRKQADHQLKTKQEVETKKNDVKLRLQEFVLQKQQREQANNVKHGSTFSEKKNFCDYKPSEPAIVSHCDPETADTEAYAHMPSSTPSSFFRILPRISPVIEDDSLPAFHLSSRSSHSRTSPRQSLASSSSSLFDEYKGHLEAGAAYRSPSRHGVLRPVGRTQSAPLPLAHPGLLGPPEMRTGKISPDLDTHAMVKHQVRQSVLSRLHKSLHGAGAASPVGQSLDPRLAIAELSQIQNRYMSEDGGSPNKVRHCSQEGAASKKQRPISRTRSSPLVTLGSATGNCLEARTGLAWDPVMLRHECGCGDHLLHPESPRRIQSILKNIKEAGLFSRCELVRRRATLDELQSCHSEDYVHRLGGSGLVGGGAGVQVVSLTCGGLGLDLDTVWNEQHTPAAAQMAVGSLIELVNRVGSGQLRNGFGLVRPPGHHAEKEQALGFCFFNNVAIAAKQFRRNFNQRVVIVDWDVHHGNGTQKEFYSDPEVMYISLHRHDGGNFFPGTGSADETGCGKGQGTNVNIAWSLSCQPLGDAEYLAALRTLILPIIKSFRPGLILVSAGFDGTADHPATLGGYQISPSCFGVLTSYLMQLTRGKVVLGLEGGYVGEQVGEGVVDCVRALLGEVVVLKNQAELHRLPVNQALEDINQTLNSHVSFWPILSESCRFGNMTHSQYLDSNPFDINLMSSLAVE